jgi:hypothetical protein
VAEDKSELQSEVLEEYKASKDVRAWGLQVGLSCLLPALVRLPMRGG